VIVLIAVFGLFVKAYAVKNGIALPPLKTLDKLAQANYTPIG